VKLEQLTEASSALQAVVNMPLETRLRLGLVRAEAVVRCVRSAAFAAQNAKLEGVLDEDRKEAILEEIWDELVNPS
jgi:hypothetical protein